MSISQQVAALAVTAVDPPSTTDAAGYGVGADGQSYVIKSPLKHPLLPVTEAFCEALATACQLPTTVGAWIDVNGVDCYGSRFESGLDMPLKAGTKLELDARKRRWQRCTNPGVATGAFAFDLFTFNYDHHHNNWSFHDQNGNTTARMFDYSKALWTLAKDLHKLPPPSKMQHLPPEHERTCLTYKAVRRWVTGDDLAAAGKVLTLLKQIGPRWVETQIKSFPASWMDDTTLGSTLAWWGSQARLDRIQQIEEGLKNGTLF